jgi:hypothetical protein
MHGASPVHFDWTFDPLAQLLRAPSGLTITVREIAHWVQDKVYHRHDLTGPWAGFRVRGRWLIGPGIKITPEALRHLLKGANSPSEPPCSSLVKSAPEQERVSWPDWPRLEAQGRKIAGEASAPPAPPVAVATPRKARIPPASPRAVRR